MSEFKPLIDEYLAGPAQLRKAIAGVTDEQLDARPVPGKWSIRDVVCHIADFEPVYADRMKRALVEDVPTVFGGDPDAFAAGLAYAARDVENELALIETVRKQMADILGTLPPEAFSRCVKHSVDGPITVQTLLERITRHIPHHIRFIEEKRTVLAGR
jgi:uncharacterized damage-inducible protein DinB